MNQIRHEWIDADAIADRLVGFTKFYRANFKDFKLHFECMTPYKPSLPLSHPGRGNSGVQGTSRGSRDRSDSLSKTR